MTLLSAIDTGEWTALCNSSRGTAEGMAAWREGWHGAGRKGAEWSPNASLAASSYTPYAPVCDAYHFTLGTLDHFDHLILANLHCAPHRHTHASHARTTATHVQARHLAPCALHPPCTLHPAPCTLHPAPCTLHHGRLESHVARGPRRSPRA